MQYRKISGPLILSQQSSGRKQTFHSDNLSLDYFLIRKLQPTLCSFFVLHASTLVVNETMFTSFLPACTLSSRGWPSSSTTAPCMQWYHVYVHLLLAESESVSHSVMSNSLRHHGLYPGRLLFPWDFPGKNIGLDCHFLLQGIFPTQGPTQIFCLAGGFFHLRHQEAAG